VLLDQKRTKRMVQVVAIITSIAFAGVIFIVLGLILFGGGGNTVADDELSDARALVEERPNDADAWERLSAAQAAEEIGQTTEAVASARRAVELDPRSYRRLQSLIALQIRTGDTEGAITSLQTYTAANPRREPEAFLQLGQIAEEAGRTQLAELSYQTFLRLAPDDTTAEEVRARLQALRTGGTATAP
jgi:tetratricopeptide (TPR) repeat protein